jgi:hypothetical protein
MMPETLLSPSNLLLYGRLVTDLAIRRVAHNPAPRVGGNTLLDAQLGRPDAEFARIYGFSYEGHYYDLAKPALFLVHGPGEIAEERAGAGPAAGAPATADRTGVAATDYDHPADLRVWSYDKGDFSIRLDIETGPLDQILLDMELESDRMRSYSGADVRMRGADVRMRGADVRMRGADVRARTRGSSD